MSLSSLMNCCAANFGFVDLTLHVYECEDYTRQGSGTTLNLVNLYDSAMLPDLVMSNTPPCSPTRNQESFEFPDCSKTDLEQELRDGLHRICEIKKQVSRVKPEEELNLRWDVTVERTVEEQTVQGGDGDGGDIASLQQSEWARMGGELRKLADEFVLREGQVTRRKFAPAKLVTLIVLPCSLTQVVALSLAGLLCWRLMSHLR